MASRSAYPAEPTPGERAALNGEPAKRTRRGLPRWAKIAIPIAVLVIIAALVGGLVGGLVGRNSDDGDNGTGSAGSGGNSPTGGTSSGGNALRSVRNSYSDSLISAASTAARSGGGNDLLFTGTDAYGNPIYKTNANVGSPSLARAAAGNCAADPANLSGSLSNLRPHPRIIAPGYEWDCLPSRIQNDAYLTVWNATIFQNASAFADMPPVTYEIDGGFTGSGILDVSRQVQQRVRAWAYAARLSGDRSWVDRTWRELQVAAANTSQPFGQDQPTPWNAQHFLDTAEMTAAFAIAYDWLYDQWNTTERAYIVDWIKRWGLEPGLQQYTTSAGWWRMPGSNNGNWNCVCNSGLILGALAIAGDDSSDLASQILSNGVENIKQGCVTGVYDDGTWSETANYWYFGTNALARAVSALTTASGTDQGILATNPDFTKTSAFHMYVSGTGGMFAYGDNGPNKYSTNANALLLLSRLSNDPRPALYQRDRADAAADPLAMFWYDTRVRGGFWNGLPLDGSFNDPRGAWVSMRSSWTDFEGTYVAMKASNATGHQTHGDLDAGDFVIDALGVRFAGELGNGDYLSDQYFASEAQDAERWQYYRKGTQGQNTLVLGLQNQQANCQPQNRFGSTNVTQSESVSFKPAASDAAFFVTDMSSAYALAAGSVKRGIRMLNARRQILLQDELSSAVSGAGVQWRVHTNASISLSADRRTATLTIERIVGANAAAAGAGLTAAVAGGARRMVVRLVEPSPAGAVFSVQGPPAERIYGSAPAQSASGVEGDQANVGVSVLVVELEAGAAPATVAVVWEPQWGDLGAADGVLPAQVALDQWTVSSHN